MKTPEPRVQARTVTTIHPVLGYLVVPLLFLVIDPVSYLHAGENWFEFRGPTGQGHTTATGLPQRWSSESANIRWKTEIPGRGWSSPIICNGRVYLTAAVAESDKPDAKQSLRTLCLDSQSGAVQWNVEVFPLEAGARAAMHRKNTQASPTPTTDGKNLFVHFGSQGTACLTLDGEILWRNREVVYHPQHGGGSSPVLVDGLLITVCDGSDVQFVVAMEQATGNIRWKKTRPPADEIKKFSFSTPLVIEVNGRKQIVSPGAHAVVAYDPADGEEIWRVRYHGYSLVPRPVYGHGLVFVCTGFDKPQLLAIRPDGQGDVTETHVKWQTDRGAPNTPSPLLIGDDLYFINDKGVATCVDAGTGKAHWTHRVGGNHSASPLFSEGKIYLQSENGESTVIRAGHSYEELARSTLPADTLASLAVDGRALLLRTDQALYRIEEP